MNVYQTDNNGFFIGITTAQPNPRSPGQFLIPRNAYSDAPPTIPTGQVARRVGGEWTLFISSTTENSAEVEATPDALRALMSLSFRQLMIGLVAEGWITEAEGDGWLVGTLPASVLLVIGQLPSEGQFAARASAVRPSIVERNNSLVVALASFEGKSPEEIDTFFTTYGSV